MSNYAHIPDPRFWQSDYPSWWHNIAVSKCRICGEPIGYDQLAKQVKENAWEHSPCLNEQLANKNLR